MTTRETSPPGQACSRRGAQGLHGELLPWAPSARRVPRYRTPGGEVSAYLTGQDPIKTLLGVREGKLQRIRADVEELRAH